MIDRLRRRFLLLLVAFFAVAPASAETFPPPRRIVAVGDLHGDWPAWRAIATAAGLIDARGRWSGGDTVLVQTGDVPDRGPDTRRIIQHLMQLRREAAAAGGRVVALVGNHEAMNVTGDLRYVHPGEYAAFVDRGSARRRDRTFVANRAAIEASYRRTQPEMKADDVRRAWIADTPLGWVEHRAAWRPDGEFGRWAIGNPAVARIGDTLFVHGGISPAFAAVPIDEINKRAAAALAAADAAPTAIINDSSGPLWYRGLVDRPEEVTAVLAATGAKRIVIGHTPILSGVAINADGALVRIDTGISASYGGALGWLEIVDGKAVARAVARPAGGEKGNGGKDD